MQITKKVKVGLVQIGEMFGDQYYLPYSIALLQAYAKNNLTHPEDFVFSLPIYKSIKIEKAVEYFSDADIIFFSVYIWNCEISLEMAKQIKQNKNDCIIVFGGPQVPERATRMEMFFKKKPFVDIASYGEGERPFLSILENFKERFWNNVPAIGFMDRGNNFVYNQPVEGGYNFEDSPSVYLEGCFDELIKDNPEQKWSVLIETNRGCPFSCSYCYWGKKTRNRLYKAKIEKVFDEIEWLSRNKIEFVFCCDANFGILERDIAIVGKVTQSKEKYGYPKAFSIQNTKNSTKKIFMIQKILNDSGLQKGVNIALQSVNTKVLKYIKRDNIAMQTYKDLQHMFARSGIPTFSDIILALPGESYDTFTKGVSDLIEGGQHNRLQFINLVILENTEMADEEYQTTYGIKTVKSKMISHHTSLDGANEVYETQNLVVETKSMPREDWVKTRVFCWMTSLLYFNKLLQIPLMMVAKISSLKFNMLIEYIIDHSQKYNEISKIITFFTKKAADIQKGDCEYVASKKWLNIWWPPDELMFINICCEGKLEVFHEEAKKIITDFLLQNEIEFLDKLLHDAIRLNRNLIKMPFVESDLNISLNYNIYEVFQGILNGIDVPLESGHFNYIIDRTSDNWHTWRDWLREVVWYGTKKGAYLYDCKK